MSGAARHLPAAFGRLLPGLLLCLGIALAARLLQGVEVALLGHSYLDALVLAILLGAAIRTAWTPGEGWRPGIALGAGRLLEVAVALLGASLDLRAVIAAGPGLLLGIAALVGLAVVAGYGIGRVLGLPRRLALLIACGNAICGNSAIAAVAPVIGANAREVAAAIAFTAILGLGAVLGLPLLQPLLGLSPTQYGVLAGLGIYAVPQVLAATAPFGSLSMQTGALVKLLRVLMLGPMVLLLALGRRQAEPGPWRPGRYLPPFILGFLLLAALHSLGLLPRPVAEAARLASGLLTAIAMAALGLGVELRALGRSGPRAAAAALAALLLLLGMGLGLIRLLGLA